MVEKIFISVSYFLSSMEHQTLKFGVSIDGVLLSISLSILFNCLYLGCLRICGFVFFILSFNSLFL